MNKDILPPLSTITKNNTNNSNKYSDDEEILEEIRKTEKQIDIDGSFSATFDDGASFKNMIEYLRLSNMFGFFIFTKDTIIYQNGNKENTILNKVLIETYELTKYTFDSKSNEIIICINLSQLRDITKGVGRNDHVNIFRIKGEPNNLYIHIRSQGETGSSEPNKFLLPCSTSDITIYDMPPYERPINNPTCTVNLKEFSKFCKYVVTIKCNHVTVHGFKNGVMFKGITHYDTIGSVKEFGECTDDKPVLKLDGFSQENVKIIKPTGPKPILRIRKLGEVEKFKISIPIIKYLIKLNGLCIGGTVKLYIEKDVPLKMICNIGSFGKMTTYLSSLE